MAPDPLAIVVPGGLAGNDYELPGGVHHTGAESSFDAVAVQTVVKMSL